MAPVKDFLYKKCGDVHKPPINSKWPFPAKNDDSVYVSDDSPVNSEETGALTLAELKSLGGRMSAMEEKMASKEATEVSKPTQQPSATASSPSPGQLDQMVVPTVAALQGSQSIQAEMDHRIRQLVYLNDPGKSKSQRGGMKLFGSRGKSHGLRTLF